jgi:hypothetical protein
MVPANVTIACVEAELAGAEAWLVRHVVSHKFDRESLVFEAVMTHPATGKALRLVGDMNGYKAVPPAWTFVDHDTNEPRQSAWPKGEPLPENAGSSIFILHRKQSVVCAPFNRLAYKDANGVHANWGNSSGWLQLQGPKHVKATTIGEMLAVIDLHLLQSKECMK